MSYVGQEQSVEAAEPVELFEFDFGSFMRFYTSAEDEVNPTGAQVYTPKAIQRDRTTDGSRGREEETRVILPASDEIAGFFTNNIIGSRVGLRILRYHRTDMSAEIVEEFNGELTGVSYRKNFSECVMAAESTFGAFGSSMPRRTYRGSCNHTLYDAVCGVDDTDPSYRASSITVASVMANSMTVTGIGGFADGWFTGGHVRSLSGDGDRRLILDHSGSTLLLMSRFFTTPTTVDILAGCAHTPTVCAVKFLNYARFGGFTGVPRRDPFRSLI